MPVNRTKSGLTRRTLVLTCECGGTIGGLDVRTRGLGRGFLRDNGRALGRSKQSTF